MVELWSNTFWQQARQWRYDMIVTAVPATIKSRRVYCDSPQDGV